MNAGGMSRRSSASRGDTVGRERCSRGTYRSTTAERCSEVSGSSCTDADWSVRSRPLAVGPGSCEFVEYLAGLVGVGGGVDAAQLAGAGPAFFPGEVAQRLADEMDDAGLVDAQGKDGSDRVGEAGEAVGANKDDVLDAAVSQFGQHARPEAGALALFDPEAEAVAGALERDADRDVDGLLAHDLVVADRHLQRVEVDDDVELLERPALPGGHVVLDRTGHFADQPLGDVDAVQLAQVPLDVTRRHAARVERKDLLVEAVERAGVLGHDPRLERGVTVPRQLDRERPIDRPQRLRRRPVAPVRLRLGRLRPERIAQMPLQLGAGRALDQPLAQLVDQAIRAGQLLRPWYSPSS